MVPPKTDTLEAAFLQAYDAYADAVFRHCYFRVFDRERGKELMQEAFLKTWEYLATGKRIDNLQAFLFKTANHLVVDHVRREKRRRVESFEELQHRGFDLADEDAACPASGLDREQVQQGLTRVREPYRTALVLRYVDGLCPREIAKVLGETANVVSVRINRGINELKQFLAHHE